MKNYLSLLMLVILIKSLPGQPVFSVFIDSVYKIEDISDKLAYIESYISNITTPVIEGETANFIYYGEADKVNLTGDFNLWNMSSWTCNRIANTNLFYYSHMFEADARLDYQFIVNGNKWQTDPLNPNLIIGPFGSNSELAMPEYIQPWEIKIYEHTSKGTFDTVILFSNELQKNYTVYIYLPSNYNNLNDLPSVYFNDGSDYINYAKACNVLDNIIDSNLIDPLIAVFIKPINRNEEYAFNDRFKYAQFVAETVVPYIDLHYRTKKNSTSRLIMGLSYGGNISGLIAYNYSSTFGNTAWQSPAMLPNSLEVPVLYATQAKNIKIYYILGTYEPEYTELNWNSFKSKLIEMEYEIKNNTYHEGHSWGHWRATIDEILQYFFPRASIIQKPSYNANTFSCYPNPASKTLNLQFSNSISHFSFLKIHNLTGQQILTQTINSNNQSIDVSHLEKGYYIISLSDALGKTIGSQSVVVY